MEKDFEPNIFVLVLIPGTPPEFIEKLLDDDIKGLVLRGYGPGNISYNYIKALEKARDMKVTVVIDSQCLKGATLMHLNDVGLRALKIGVIQAYDMNIESITTKLMWALKRTPYEKMEEVMHTDFTVEINKEGKIY